MSYMINENPISASVRPTQTKFSLKVDQKMFEWSNGIAL